MLLCRLLIYFKINFFEKFFQEYTIRVPNSLDPDQARHFLGPDLGPNCFQRLSADDTSRQRVKITFCKIKTNLSETEIKSEN